MMLNYYATALIKFKIEHCDSIRQRLFSLLILGDERTHKNIYIMGTKNGEKE